MPTALRQVVKILEEEEEEGQKNNKRCAIQTWDSLFTATTRMMRTDMGIETKQRKYILAWREFYRQGRDLHAVPLKTPKKKK